MADKRHRKPKRPIDTLTTAEIHRIMKACGGSGAIARRNRAMTVLLWRAGLRVGEMLALLPKDVDLHKGTIRVHLGKGAKPRTVGIDSDACDVISVWLAMRQLIPGVTEHAPLICRVKSGLDDHVEELTESYPRKFYRQIGKELGFSKRVTPHIFRHNFATELVREGVDIKRIQQLLGHKSLEATSKYLSTLMPIEAIQAILARPSWLSIEKP
jgi:site-specific recombinase XerD